MSRFGPDTQWTPKLAFEQLEYCGYECEGGPLRTNVAFIWLKAEIARLQQEVEDDNSAVREVAKECRRDDEKAIAQLTARLATVDEYVAALERLRRHKRAMRATRCEDSEGPPCWMERDGLDMCDKCLLRQVAYHFRGVATKDVGRLRRKIERDARRSL